MTFPPGRARLVTNPSRTGSLIPMKTIGIVLVRSLAVRARNVLAVTMMSTFIWRNSVTKVEARSFFPSRYRRSMARFLSVT